MSTLAAMLVASIVIECVLAAASADVASTWPAMLDLAVSLAVSAWAYRKLAPEAQHIASRRAWRLALGLGVLAGVLLQVAPLWLVVTS